MGVAVVAALLMLPNARVERVRMRSFDPSSLKDLVEFISIALVDEPSAVQVSEIVGDQTTVIELKVAKSDTGKVIGRDGRTAGALRTLLTGASAKLKRRAVLEFLED